MKIVKLQSRFTASASLAAASIVLMAITPSPAVDQVYRVSDLGKPGIPALSSGQRDWLRKIERTPYYKQRLPTLWFVPQPAGGKNEPPLIVFDAHSTSRAAVESNHVSRGFWVIGERCNVVYVQGFGEMPMSDLNDPDCESGKAQVKP
jgi:hypothetical protein